MHAYTCSSRTFRGTPQMKFERAHERTVASIGEGSDDKTSRVPKVLVAIGDVRGDHPNDDLFVLKVVAELRDPLKVIGCVYTVFTQLGNDITSCE